MMKSILAAGVSLLTLTAVAEAKTVGHVAAGVNYVDWDEDLFGGKNVDWWQFNFEGAAAFDLTDTWNVQFDTAFNSDRVSSDVFGGKNVAFDTWRAGSQLFWRDPTQGMVGLEVAYQSMDIQYSIDGILVALRGEYYASDAFTVGGSIAYDTFDAGPVSFDTFTGTLFGTYYLNEKTGLTLTGKYGQTDFDVASTNIDSWSLGANVEYLFQNNMSLGGGLSYRSTDVESTDLSRLTVGLNLKVYFGTEGSLANQHRTGSLAPTRSEMGLPFFGGI